MKLKPFEFKPYVNKPDDKLWVCTHGCENLRIGWYMDNWDRGEVWSLSYMDDDGQYERITKECPDNPKSYDECIVIAGEWLLERAKMHLQRYTDMVETP